MRKGVPEFAQRSKIMIVSRTESTEEYGEEKHDRARWMPLTDLTSVFSFSVISVLLTFKIFEACADFLTPDGLRSCRKRRNFGAHRSLVQSCGCGLASPCSLWLQAFVFR